MRERPHGCSRWSRRQGVVPQRGTALCLILIFSGGGVTKNDGTGGVTKNVQLYSCLIRIFFYSPIYVVSKIMSNFSIFQCNHSLSRATTSECTKGRSFPVPTATAATGSTRCGAMSAIAASSSAAVRAARACSSLTTLGTSAASSSGAANSATNGAQSRSADTGLPSGHGTPKMDVDVRSLKLTRSRDGDPSVSSSHKRPRTSAASSPRPPLRATRSKPCFVSCRSHTSSSKEPATPNRKWWHACTWP